MQLPTVRIAFVVYAIAGILSLFWLALVGFLYVNQRRMLYLPDPTRVAPHDAKLRGVSEEIIETPDGEKLISWWSPPKPGKPTILYFHGNGGNLAGRAGRLQLFQEAGFGGLMLANRSYSGSTGQPSERAFIADAKLAFDRLVARGIAADHIIVFGESLGTGLAVQVAADRPARALILDSPYTSIADVAAGRLPWIPARYLLSDTFDSIGHIGKVRMPLLVVHGDRDDVVPYVLGRRLFAAANEPKQFLTLPGAGHVTPLREGPWTSVKSFIEGLGAAR